MVECLSSLTGTPAEVRERLSASGGGELPGGALEREEEEEEEAEAERDGAREGRTGNSRQDIFESGGIARGLPLFPVTVFLPSSSFIGGPPPAFPSPFRPVGVEECPAAVEIFPFVGHVVAAGLPFLPFASAAPLVIPLVGSARRVVVEGEMAAHEVDVWTRKEAPLGSTVRHPGQVYCSAYA